MRGTNGRPTAGRLIRLAAGLVGLLTIACGGSPPPAGSSGAGAVTPVKVVTGAQIALGQFYSMFFVGVDQGFYRRHGIDPTFVEGKGSGTSSQQIANGQFDFGVEIGAAALVAAVAHGADIKMVAQDDPVAPMAVLSVPPKLIQTPRDMIGKTICVPPGTTQAQVFPAFLKANNLQANQINLVSCSLNGIQAALLQGRIDGYISYAQSNIPLLHSMGANQAHAMTLSDFGFKLSPDAGIVTTKSMIKNKPDLVRRFVAAVDDSINYAIGHVEQSCAAAATLFPQSIKPDVCQQQLSIEVTNIQKTRTPGKAVTWMSPSGWETQINDLVTYGGVPKVGSPSDYYTNEFVPSR
jgi:NitT/TauT family transport system substrate-binding protein